MCRLLAYASPSPRTLAEALGQGDLAQFTALARLHSDGWGTAHVDGDTVAMAKSAHDAASDPGYLASTTGRRSRAGIAHLRLASRGLARTPANTHPFVGADGRWAFAHNGGAAPAELIEPLLDPRLRAGLGGTTDSERYAALVATLRRGGLPTAHAAAAAVEQLRPIFPTASFNALLLTPSELVVVHASSTATPPRAELAARGVSEADLPAGHGAGYFQLWMRRSDDGSVVVASSGMADMGWTPVTPETVLRVDLATLAVSTVPLAVPPVAGADAQAQAFTSALPHQRTARSSSSPAPASPSSR